MVYPEDISFEKTGRPLPSIIVKGHKYSVNEFGLVFSCRSGVRIILRKLDDDPEWVKKRLACFIYRAENDLPGNISVFYHDKKFIDTDTIREVTGLGVNGAILRGQKFDRGQITYSKLMEKKANSGCRAKGSSKIEKDRRASRLDKIPSPTEFEKRLWGREV